MLQVFSCDNGGEQGGPGNNYPLRGGKYTDFEGGVRQAAFASGGLIPPTVRGTTSAEIIAIADMWATFSVLAGGDAVDHKAAAIGGVPPVDSVDVSAVFLSVGGRSNRDTIVLSSTAVTKGAFKVVHESAGGKNIWVGSEWPAYDNNGSSVGLSTKGPACSPCLFNVVNDTEERHDLSAMPEYASTLADLLDILNKTVPFQTGDDGYQGNYTNCTTVAAYKAAHADFLGPVCYPCAHPPCTSPTPPPPPPPPGPAKAGELLRSMTSGLCVQFNGARAGVSLTSCNNASAMQRWSSNGEGAVLPSQDSSMCLRPTNPPKVPASCVAGNGVMAGLNACIQYSRATQQLNATSSSCTGLCVSPSPDHTHIELQPCGTQAEWELVPVSN